jgi:hypothetical protein
MKTMGGTLAGQTLFTRVAVAVILADGVGPAFVVHAVFTRRTIGVGQTFDRRTNLSDAQLQLGAIRIAFAGRFVA